ncbi:MAG: hypothetical protein ABIF77_13290 [bacterium]
MSVTARRAGELLGGLDRRWVYLILAVSLAVSLLAGLRFPDRPSALVMPLYDTLESLPPGSPILISLEYTPSTLPELEPMAFALCRHACLRGHRLCFMSLWPEGNNLIGRVVEQVISREFPQLEAGVDWVVLGYQAGNEMLINAISQDLGSMYQSDIDGRPLAGLPALAGIHSLADFRLIVALSAGTPGLKEWILFAGDPLGVPVAGGCSGAGSPQFLPYFPRQLIGLLAGMKGGAEYETALQQGHPEYQQPTQRASESMGPQAVAHVVIIGFILLGNMGAFLVRRRLGGDPE